ncbi:MAG: right-handed parallel beta-helix repeat-containing protein, partial [Saprospiraceae bacterium]|nr:right-handed parallel beta-helix repeat-containing protein [Saprospiraceae bacterium]
MKSSIITVLRLICMLQIFVWCGCSLETTEYFVSPNGHDRNSGDEQHPLATLEQAKTLAFTDLSTGVRKQITIWLETGEYRIKNPIHFSSSDLPTAGFNLTIKCKEKGEAIVSGAILLDQWYPLQKNLWALDLDQLENAPTYLRELFINGKRAPRARFPNQGYLRAEKVGEDKRTYFYFKKGDFPIPRSVQQTELTLLHDWSITRIPIAVIDTQDNLIRAKDTIGAKVLNFFTLDNWELQPRYFLENDSAFIDQDYEWCYDSEADRVLLQIPEEQNIDSLHILIPLSEGLIKMTGSFDKPLKNIHFENLIFRHSAWNLPTSGYAGIQATYHDPRPDQAKGWSVVPAAIYAEFTDSCSFINCSLENLGGSGLWLDRGCADNRVSNCTFSDISGNGIMIGEGQHRVVHGEPWWKTVPNEAARNNLIETCQINDCGIQFFGAVGI